MEKFVKKWMENKKKTEYGKGGGGLTQSIKSLTKKFTENSYFQYRDREDQEIWSFPHSVSFYHSMAPLREAYLYQ